MEDPFNGGIGGVTDRELRWSTWWVDHRESARKLGIGLLAGLDVALLAFGAWGFTDWLAVGGLKEEQAIRQMTGASYGRFGGVGLQELQPGAPFVLPGGSGASDILASVENPNAGFWAEIEYRFIVGGVEQPLRTASVLPLRARYLTQLGAPSSVGSGIELKVERRRWHRAGTFGADSLQSVYDTRLDIRAENPVFRPADPQATAPVSSAQFTLANRTAFGYYDVDLLALLYRGEAVVGVGQVRVDRLAAGERKPMELFWYQPLSQVTRVDVVPDINIYDPDIYLRAGA